MCTNTFSSAICAVILYIVIANMAALFLKVNSEILKLRKF